MSFLPTMNELLAILAAFAVGFTPMLELRFGIIVGLGMDGPAWAVIPAAVIGNILQLFFALPAIRWADEYGRRRWRRLAEWLEKVEAGAIKHRHLITRFGVVGLILFVVLPLPGTGVWGGVLVGRLLRMTERMLWLGLASGVAVSGALFGLGSWGVFSAVEKWFGL